MNTFTGFIKVRVGLCYITNSVEEKDTEAFHDRIIDIEEELRSKIMLPLNDTIGLHNWAIQFVQLTPLSKEFFVDIHADNQQDYVAIFYTIRDILKNYRLTPFYQGPVQRLWERWLHAV